MAETTTTSTELTAATTALRAHLRQTQTQFAAALGVKQSTITRWEVDGPAARHWPGLAKLSRECGRPDLAAVFEEALGIGSVPGPIDYSPEERRYTDLLVQLLRDKDDPASQSIKAVIEGFIEAQRQRKVRRS